MKKNNSPKQFPSIYRIINDRDLLLILFSTLVGTLAIILVSSNLYKNYKLSMAQKVQKENLVKEQMFWQGIVNKYPDYRDGYFELSEVDYRLGENDLSEINIQKSLMIDPNFVQGNKFEGILTGN